MNVSVRVTDREPVTVAQLEGEVDIANVEAVSRQLRDGTSNDALGLVIDCSEVRYVDSAGIRMLFELAGHLTTGRRGLALAVPKGSPLRRLFEVTHINMAAPVCETVAEAVTQLTDMSENRII